MRACVTSRFLLVFLVAKRGLLGRKFGVRGWCANWTNHDHSCLLSPATPPHHSFNTSKNAQKEEGVRWPKESKGKRASEREREGGRKEGSLLSFSLPSASLGSLLLLLLMVGRQDGRGGYKTPYISYAPTCTCCTCTATYMYMAEKSQAICGICISREREREMMKKISGDIVWLRDVRGREGGKVL